MLYFTRRSSARLAAVQALYEIDIVGAPATPVLTEFLEHRWSESTLLNHNDQSIEDAIPLPKPEKQFLIKIVRGVTDDLEVLDSAIGPLLNSPWVIDQLDTLVRSILRAGAFEFMRCPDIRARIVISEYVGLAHAFFSDNEPAFINGVLDGLAGHYRREEFIEKTVSSS